MVSVAWESALEDWFTDTRERSQLDYTAFADSVFELTTCYAEQRTAAACACSLARPCNMPNLDCLAYWPTFFPPADCSFLKELHDGTTKTDAKGGTLRSWRQTYPVESNRQPVATAVDNVRSALRALSSNDLPSWVTKHGGRFSSTASTSDEQGVYVGTPADLMASLMKSAEEAHGAGKLAEEAMLREVLMWISSAEGHALCDDMARGRLISLFRALDAESHDGLLSAADLMGAAPAPRGAASTSRSVGSVGKARAGNLQRSGMALMMTLGGSRKRMSRGQP